MTQVLICAHANYRLVEARDLAIREAAKVFQHIALCDLCGGRWIAGEPEPKVILGKIEDA